MYTSNVVIHTYQFYLPHYPIWHTPLYLSLNSSKTEIDHEQQDDIVIFKYSRTTSLCWSSCHLQYFREIPCTFLVGLYFQQFLETTCYTYILIVHYTDSENLYSRSFCKPQVSWPGLLTLTIMDILQKVFTQNLIMFSSSRPWEFNLTFRKIHVLV